MAKEEIKDDILKARKLIKKYRNLQIQKSVWVFFKKRKSKEELKKLQFRARFNWNPLLSSHDEMKIFDWMIKSIEKKKTSLSELLQGFYQ